MKLKTVLAVVGCLVLTGSLTFFLDGKLDEADKKTKSDMVNIDVTELTDGSTQAEISIASCRNLPVHLTCVFIPYTVEGEKVEIVKFNRITKEKTHIGWIDIHHGKRLP